MSKIKWSILICSIPERKEKLSLLKAHLEKQIEPFKNFIQLLILETPRYDEGGPSVGSKRNQLVKQAQGEYINFIDDDDWVSDDYVSEIMKAMGSKADVIAFDMLMTHTGRDIAVHVDRSLLNANPEGKARERMPNHINPVKKKLAAEFPDASFGEDTQYAIRLKPVLKNQHKINKQLYHYRFDAELSATHKYNPIHKMNDRSSGKHNPMVKMDVIIVSDGTRPELRKLTQKAINSIASPYVNIIIVEKAKIKYQFADTISQPDFNYNACLNVGSSFGNSKLIAFCNNDIVFPGNFVQAIENIKDFDVLSFKDSYGYMPKEMISGHCFVMTREAFIKIGKLNEKYMFWCADNVTSEQIKEHGLKELKTNIQVDHIRSASLKLLDGRKRYTYTTGSARQFERDYNKKVLS